MPWSLSCDFDRFFGQPGPVTNRSARMLTQAPDWAKFEAGSAIVGVGMPPEVDQVFLFFCHPAGECQLSRRRSLQRKRECVPQMLSFYLAVLLRFQMPGAYDTLRLKPNRGEHSWLSSESGKENARGVLRFKKATRAQKE